MEEIWKDYKGKYLGLFNTEKEAYEKVNNEND